jgi:hypothetical protein
LRNHAQLIAQCLATEFQQNGGNGKTPAPLLLPPTPLITTPRSRFHSFGIGGGWTKWQQRHNRHWQTNRSEAGVFGKGGTRWRSHGQPAQGFVSDERSNGSLWQKLNSPQKNW